MTVVELSEAELAGWRKDRDVVRSAPGRLAPPPEEPEPEPVPFVVPLHARETFDATFDPMYASMVATRQDYDQALSWLRATTPGLAHYSDVELRDVLRKKVEAAVRQALTIKGLNHPVVDLARSV